MSTSSCAHPSHAYLDRTLVVGPFQCNCRVLACPETGEALVVDPGDEPQEILSFLEGCRTPTGAPIRVKYLFHTHAHLDHIGGTRDVKQGLEAATQVQSKILLHRDDEQLYRALKMQGQLFGMSYEEPLPVDEFVADEQSLEVGKLRFSVIHTPGHSPGGVCLRLHEDSALGAPESVFSGDTLFQGSVGRTDLWGGDTDTLIRSIKTRLLTLDGDTRVCPGHGPETRMGVEKRENPFLR